MTKDRQISLKRCIKHNGMGLHETSLIKLSLGSNKVEQGLFRKYEFPCISSNTKILDTIAFILKSTLTSIMDSIPIDLS